MNKVPKLIALQVEFDDKQNPVTLWYKKVEIAVEDDGTEFGRKELPMDRVPIDSDEGRALLALLQAGAVEQVATLQVAVIAAEKAKADVDAALAEEQQAHAETKALVAALETEKVSLTDANASLGEQRQEAVAALAVEQEAHAETKATLEAATPVKE